MRAPSYRRGKGQSGLYQIKPRVRAFPDGTFRFSVNNSGSVFYGYGNTIENAIQDTIKNKQMINQLLETILDDTYKPSVQSPNAKFAAIRRIYTLVRELITRK